MEIEPPQPASPDTGRVPRAGRGYLAMLLLWLVVLIVITMIAWAMLWSGGVKEAAPEDRGSGGGGAKMEQPQPS